MSNKYEELEKRLSTIESKLTEVEIQNLKLTNAIKGTISRITEFTRDTTKFHIDCKKAIESLQESVELNILSIEVINSTLEIIMEKYKTLKSNQTLDKMKKI